MTPTDKEKLVSLQHHARQHGCFIVEKPDGFILYRANPHGKSTRIGRRNTLRSMGVFLHAATTTE